MAVQHRWASSSLLFLVAASCTPLDDQHSLASASGDLVDPGENPTQCFGMHCCPAGFGVRGLHVGHNDLLCHRVNQLDEDCFIDGPTQRAGMHACPRGTYVRGVHVDSNRLTCCYDRERGFSELFAEIVDGSPPHQELGMHACANPNGAGPAFVTGIHVDSNKLLCAAAPATPSRIAAAVNIHLDPEAPRTFLDFFPVTSHATWKAAVRNWLLRQFDVDPGASYLREVQVRDDAPPVVVKGGVTRRLISYPSLVDGTRIPAYLFLPRGFSATRAYRGALVLHGHFKEAKEGLGVQWQSPLHAIGLYLAGQGFVTLAPDTRTWGSYRAPRELPWLWTEHYSITHYLRASSGGNWGSLPQQTLIDNLVSVTVLAHQARLSSIAVEGLSLGSDQAMWLAAVDERIGDVILAGNFMSFACLNDPRLNHACQTVPGISHDIAHPAHELLLDAGDVAALFAPRRLYVMWGDADERFTQQPAGSSISCGQAAAEAARAIYGVLDRSDRFRTELIAGLGHEIDNARSWRFLVSSTDAGESSITMRASLTRGARSSTGPAGH